MRKSTSLTAQHYQDRLDENRSFQQGGSAWAKGEDSGAPGHRSKSKESSSGERYLGCRRTVHCPFHKGSLGPGGDCLSDSTKRTTPFGHSLSPNRRFQSSARGMLTHAWRVQNLQPSAQASAAISLSHLRSYLCRRSGPSAEVRACGIR